MKIDARDNGLISPKDSRCCYSIGDAIKAFVPTWLEDPLIVKNSFNEVLSIAKRVLEREIISKAALELGLVKTRAEIEKQNRPQVLVLPKQLEWQEAVIFERNVKVVIYPDDDNTWSVRTAMDDLEDYQTNRAFFPERWWGLREEELENVSGIKGAVFCINKGWFAVAKTKEAAMELAKKVIIKTD
jgi:uncharacterized UPF0160 family protein